MKQLLISNPSDGLAVTFDAPTSWRIWRSGETTDSEMEVTRFLRPDEKASYSATWPALGSIPHVVEAGHGTGVTCKGTGDGVIWLDSGPPTPPPPFLAQQVEIAGPDPLPVVFSGVASIETRDDVNPIVLFDPNVIIPASLTAPLALPLGTRAVLPYLRNLAASAFSSTGLALQFTTSGGDVGMMSMDSNHHVCALPGGTASVRLQNRSATNWPHGAGVIAYPFLPVSS